MINSRTIWFLSLIMVLAAFPIYTFINRQIDAFSKSTISQTGGKHALLIGIEDYDSQKTGFHSLKGTLNDIELTQGVLHERFGFSDDQFLILKDAQATHTGIEKAFMTLIERVQPGDFVYIHYSGHGSQTADLNGDELSGKDQTWVTYGARSSDEVDNKDNYDVLDDEINAWLSKLYDKTDQIVFVSDSCHSATVGRGTITRAIDNDDRPHILGQRPYTQRVKHRGIRVGAARDDESAISKQRSDGKDYGVLSWHWLHSLQQAQAGDTWEHIYKRTYTQVEAERVVQRPQMEGEAQKQVLGGGFIPQPPTISVIPINDDWVELKAGRIAGVTEGSIYRLYQPQHRNPQSLPSLTITKVTSFNSYAQAKPKDAFKTGDLVVEERHAYHFTPLTVYLKADFPEQDQPLLQRIQTAFKNHSGVTQPLAAYQLTDDPANVDLRLHLLRPKRQNGQLIREKADALLPKSFPEQPPELWVLTPEQRLLHKNLQIHFDNPTKGLQLLQENLKKIARVREVKTLQNRRYRQEWVTLQAHLMSPVPFCPDTDCEYIEELDQDYRQTNGPYSLSELQTLTLDKEQLVTFTLHNQSDYQGYYCYLLNIGPDGAIYAIFPPKYERPEYALVRAGNTRELIEDHLGLITNLEGKETLKLIVSREPIDVRLLEQQAFKQRSQFNPLERLLFIHAVHGKRGRALSGKNAQWATGLTAFEVK